MPIQFEEAREQILEATRTLDPEQAQLLDAVGRVLAEDFHAPWDLPLWDNSAMDGFAVQAADAATGTELEITGYIPAGGSELPPVARGCAVKIMTGAPIPPGCDLVVPVEETEERDGKVRLLTTSRFANIFVSKGKISLLVPWCWRPALCCGLRKSAC